MLGVSAAGPLAEEAHGGVDPVGSVVVDPYAAERDAWTILTSAHGLGPLTFAALLAHFGTGRRILDIAHGPDPIRRLMATPPRHQRDRERQQPVGLAIARAILDAVDAGEATVRRVRELGVRVLTVEEPAYPPRLAMIAMPPHVLFVTGDPAALSMDRAVAVVGTRRATSAGRTTAGRVATALVAAEAAVISGLAFGIDGAAHEATVRAGGRTVAVIGGGHAAAAPRSHARLGAAIVAAGGAIVSELGPGRRTVARHVPATEPDHQRPRRRDGRDRGARAQRRAHHGVVGARAGTRVLPRPGRSGRPGVGGLPVLPA
jgi:DNA processing protein